jgi:hypothetical protein
LERVKGIEPSYSAWKAAALPLSYTRALAMNYHATETASTAMRQISCVKGCVPPSSFAPRGPLTGGDSVPILMFPSTQRKEVIQCLIPSAVTSLGSPAKLFQAWQQGALSAWTSEHKSQGATGAIPSRLFCASTLCRALDFAPGHFARSSGDSGEAVARNAQPRLSSSAKADDQVRRGLSALSLTLVEYWIARWSLSSGGAQRRPGGGR